MRTLRMLLMFLIIGAIINIAVAWGIAAYGPFGECEWSVPLFADHEAATWQSHLDKPATPFAFRPFSVNGSGFRMRIASNDQDKWDLNIECGWPLQSLNMTEIGDQRNAIVVHPRHPRNSEAARVSYLLGRRYLPLSPKVVAFAINTAIYAAFVWAVFIVLSVVRKRWRYGRNLCLKCAYPIGSSDTCTECGNTVKRKIFAQKGGAA